MRVGEEPPPEPATTAKGERGRSHVRVEHVGEEAHRARARRAMQWLKNGR
jgi:hypothetical protein